MDLLITLLKNFWLWSAT